MAYKRYQVDNFFITTIAEGQTLNPGVDGTLNLVNVPNIEDGKLFFVVFNVNDVIRRKVVPVYMDDGFVKYHGYSIDEVIALSKYDEVALNDVAELFNTLFELTDDIGRAVPKGGLDIIVYGGTVVKGNQIIELDDIELTLDDNMINYIIFDYSDNEIKAATSLSGAYYLFSTVSTSGGEVIKTDRNKGFNINEFYSNLFFDRDNAGELIIKDGAIKEGHIDFYTFTADDIFQGGSHLFLTPTERLQIAANTADRHNHINKSLLDTYTQTDANIKSAVDQKHGHANKDVLDLIPDIDGVPDGYVPKKVGSTIVRGIGGGSGGGDGNTTVAHTEIFVGDGVSDVFNLSFLPLNDDVVFMTNDSGQHYYLGLDYDRDGQEIIFNSVPDVGRKIYVRYFEALGVALVGETNTMRNLDGTGIGVYKKKEGVEFQMRRVRGVNGITVTQDGDEVVIDGLVSVGPGGEANTASNIGAGIGLYKTKEGVDLQFKTIGGSDVVEVGEDNDTITIALNESLLRKNFYRHFMF